MELGPLPVTGTLSDRVYAVLLNQILSGRWPAEQAVPSERDLAATLNVTRHVVREALKRLLQAGLVRISQGGSTLVQDWRTHAGLEMGMPLVAAGAVPFGVLFRDTAVLRRTVGVDAARLCALHASEEQLAEVTAIAAAFPKTGTLAELQVSETAFWTAIVVGSGNISYRLALNTLMRGIDEVGAEMVSGLNEVVLTNPGGHIELAAALAARDADTAARLAEGQLSHLIDAFPASG